MLSAEWDIQHHVLLESGAEIDIVAQSKDNPKEILVIECKPKLHRQKFYTAVGQVLCYCSEFPKPAVPTIAAYSSELTDYMVTCCDKMQIKLIAIDE